MRIGINLLCIIPGVNGGVETYSVSLLRALASAYPENEYIVFVNRLGAKLSILNAPNVTPVVCDFDARSRGLRYAWEHLILPRLFRRHGIEIVHSPGYQGPAECPCPCVVTLPDLNFIALRDTFPLHRRLALGYFCPRSARLASHVITISQFSKSEIVKHLRIPEEKVTVTTLACALQPPRGEWEMVARTHGINSDYVVTFAGNNWPHKNMPRLFEAFRRVSKREGVRLAVIGALSPRLRAVAAARNIDLLELGFVRGEHLAQILSHARLCVLPSLYEGFGLSVLEAQAAEVPLACSTAASLPEVAGKGATFFDPTSIEAITGAIEDCLTDHELCEGLVRAGRENVKRFSWDKTAEQTLAVYQCAAGLGASSRTAGAAK